MGVNSNMSDGLPFYIRARSEEEQTWIICNSIEQLRQDGVQLDEMAVLFRASRHANHLEIELARQGIPFIKYGGSKFAELAHIKDMLALIKIMVNTSDQIAWRRVLELFDGLGEKTAERIYRMVEQHGYAELYSPEFVDKKYSQNLQDLLLLIDEVGKINSDPAAQLRAVSKFYRQFIDQKYNDSQTRKKDLTTVELIAEKSIDLQDFLDSFMIDPIEQDKNDDGQNKLVLSTIHSAKGLEWHTVFIIHLIDGCFPCSFALEDDEQIEEERRLLYVASTRAKQNLVLISPKINRKSNGNFYDHRVSPSCFIVENIEFRKVTKEWAVVD